MTGGMTGGHFIGFYLAILGLCVIVYASTRPSVVHRLGSKRWPRVALGILACFCLAVFGSGHRETYFQTALGPSDSVVSHLEQRYVDEALAEILRPAFVQYLERLEGAEVVIDAAQVSRSLSVRVGTTVDLFAEGYHFDIPPKVGQTWLLVSYKDRENALLGIVGSDTSARRFVFAERLVSKVLPQAVAIMALRAAKTDAEKLAILNENPFVLPYAAEWLLVEIEKLAKDASPEVARELTHKKAYIQKYADDPVARGLPAGIRVEAP